MTVADQFQAALSRAGDRPEPAGPGGEGTRAAAEVLRADGAGVGLAVDQLLRLPWGAIDEAAALTQQLQFTAGQGPSLDAFAGRQAVMASRLVGEKPARRLSHPGRLRSTRAFRPVPRPRSPL